jgi:predicted PurR-regulated permease PerM
MQVLIAFVIGLVIWIVLWALGAKADDAFLPTIVLVLVGAIARLATPYIRELLKP